MFPRDTNDLYAKRNFTSKGLIPFNIFPPWLADMFLKELTIKEIRELYVTRHIESIIKYFNTANIKYKLENLYNALHASLKELFHFIDISTSTHCSC